MGGRISDLTGHSLLRRGTHLHKIGAEVDNIRVCRKRDLADEAAKRILFEFLRPWTGDSFIR